MYNRGYAGPDFPFEPRRGNLFIAPCFSFSPAPEERNTSSYKQDAPLGFLFA